MNTNHDPLEDRDPETEIHMLRVRLAEVVCENGELKDALAKKIDSCDCANSQALRYYIRSLEGTLGRVLDLVSKTRADVVAALTITIPSDEPCIVRHLQDAKTNSGAALSILRLTRIRQGGEL